MSLNHVRRWLIVEVHRTNGLLPDTNGVHRTWIAQARLLTNVNPETLRRPWDVHSSVVRHLVLLETGRCSHGQMRRSG